MQLPNQKIEIRTEVLGIESYNKDNKVIVHAAETLTTEEELSALIPTGKNQIEYLVNEYDILLALGAREQSILESGIPQLITMQTVDDHPILVMPRFGWNMMTYKKNHGHVEWDLVQGYMSGWVSYFGKFFRKT